MKIDILKSFKEKGIEIADGQEAVLNELSASVNKAIDEQGKTFEKALSEAITKTIGEAAKDDKGNIIPLMTQLKNISEDLEGLATKRLEKLSNLEKFQLKKIIEEKHSEIVKAVKEKQQIEFVFKAAETHSTTNTVSNNPVGLALPLTDNIFVDNDITLIRRPENFILNVIPNRQVAKVPQQYFMTGQQTTEGAVAVTAEGAVKPLLQYKFVRTATGRKKYAGRIEWTEEFEMDFEALFFAIVRMFEEDVLREWQNGIITQITTNAVPYVSSVLDGTFVQPDNGLAVVATQSALQALNFTPDTVLMNPSDLVATLYIQNADGDLKQSPYINTTTGTVAGMRLFSNNTITAGTAYVGDSRVYQELHSDYIARTGQYGDQLITNEYTMIGEIFSVLAINEQNLGAWVEIDLDAVKTLLQKV